MLKQYFTKIIINGASAAVLVLNLNACRKFVTIDPPTQSMVQETVFRDAKTTAAALKQAYFLVAVSSGYMSQLNTLYADEYRLTSTHNGLQMMYTNAPDAVEITFSNLWSTSYADIYRVNAIIEGLEKYGAPIEKSLKDQMIGEAKLLRSYVYFNLVNAFGNVPLVLTTDYEKNRLLARTSTDVIYEQIIKDLTEAKELIKSDYLDWSNVKVVNSRLRATKEVAAALLARVYLYRGEWEKAESNATEVISKTSVYSLEAVPADAFNTNSKETLLAFDDQGGNRPRAVSSYVLTSNPTNSTSTSQIGVISDTLMGSFEEGDNRKRDWVGIFTTGGNSYYFAHKYRTNTILTQYDNSMRLAEVCLIRAEARMEQGFKQLAIDDLNVLRDRARAAVTIAVPNPLPALPSTLTPMQVRLAMEKERFTELFTEGHRWFDFKRWKGINNPAINRADEAMPWIAGKKGGVWKAHLKWLPIPQKELTLNVNLKQTQGY